MPPVGFEPTISAGERPQTYALVVTKFTIYIFLQGSSFCQCICFNITNRTETSQFCWLCSVCVLCYGNFELVQMLGHVVLKPYTCYDVLKKPNTREINSYISSVCPWNIFKTSFSIKFEGVKPFDCAFIDPNVHDARCRLNGSNCGFAECDIAVAGGGRGEDPRMS